MRGLSRIGYMSVSEAVVQVPSGPSTTEIERKAQAAVTLLRAAVRDYGKVVYSNSLGAESMVLTDLIWTHVPQIAATSVASACTTPTLPRWRPIPASTASTGSTTVWPSASPAATSARSSRSAAP